LSRYHTKIILVPIVVNYSKIHGNNEGRLDDKIAESGPKLAKQLLNSFSIIVITVDVHDSLVLDQSTASNLDLFNKTRNQWKSSMILEWTLREMNPNSYTKILAICDLDAYSNGLNFVFGEAHRGGRVGAIYLSRLRQEFYGFLPDADLFQQRIIKEAIHELGHVFGLSHCEKRSCIMHFSNSLRDTDFKDPYFCNRCNGLLI
jgi:archaemetzincin